MRTKLKNVLIVLLTLIGLIFNSQVLADPASKYEEIKAKIDALDPKKCNYLLGKTEKYLACINELMNEMSRLKAELDKYSKEIGAKVDELQKDVQSLNNQISYLNANIEKTEIEMALKDREINLLELDISRTEEEIKEKEEEIQETRERIGELIRSFYEYDKQNLITITLFEGNLSDFFDEVIYINNLQESIGDALEDFKGEKKVLDLNKKTLEERVETVLEVKEELSKQASSFNIDKQNKAVLLEITKGDEEVYKELLGKIEAQKKQLLGDLSRLSRARAAEIAALIAKYGPRIPGSSFGNFTYYAQDSGVWSSWWINGIPPPVGGTMADYGCAITSTAIVFRHYGKSVNPGTLSQDSRILSGILISFPSAGNVYGIPCVSGCSRVHNINWSTVTNYLVNKQKPVILMIETSPYAGDHFVVAIGKVGQKYYVYDPLYAVSRGMAVDLNVSIENIKGIYGRNASVTRMILFSP